MLGNISCLFLKDSSIIIYKRQNTGRLLVWLLLVISYMLDSCSDSDSDLWGQPRASEAHLNKCKNEKSGQSDHGKIH